MATLKTPASRKAAGSKAATANPWKVIESPTATARQRAAALAELDWSIASDRTRYRAVLAIATDRAQHASVRNAALSAAHSVSFDAQHFPALRPDYLRALRKLGDDADTELRQRSLGMLMREGDAATEQRLLIGLDNPADALLPAAKSLQLLSYQLHSQTYDAARRIAGKGDDLEAREAALRLLAADATSTPLFERLIANKQEPSELRRLAATALHQLAPEKLQKVARTITLDESDDESLRTSCLVAMTNFGDAKAMESDTQLQAYVGGLSGGAGDGQPLNQAAQQFLGRHKREGSR
jgi:hypothetical protein